MQIAVEIPDNVLNSSRLEKAELEAAVRIEIALLLYQRQAVSEGKAAEIAGLNRWDFSKLLGQRGILRNYGMDDLEHDLAWVKDQARKPESNC